MERSPSRKVLQRELPTLVKADGVVVEERNGFKLWHHKDVLTATRGGTLMLRINRAVIQYPTGYEIYYPMKDAKDAKDYFDTLTTVAKS